MRITLSFRYIWGKQCKKMRSSDLDPLHVGGFLEDAKTHDVVHSNRYTIQSTDGNHGPMLDFSRDEPYLSLCKVCAALFSGRPS